MSDTTIEIPQHTTTEEDLAGLRRQMNTLAESLELLRQQVAGQSKTISDLAARLEAASKSWPQPQSAAATENAIGAEVLVVIAAAVTSFLGKKVRIRSAKMLQSPYEVVNPWAQQGRVFVQASHALYRL